jgi:hypothetical protein
MEFALQPGMQAEELQALMDRKLAEIPADVLKKAIDVLDAEFARASWEAQIRNLRDNYGPAWVSMIHHDFGTYIRNVLREAGLKDDLLPGGNWDDYYGPVVEIVAGIRRLPEAAQASVEECMERLGIGPEDISPLAGSDADAVFVPEQAKIDWEKFIPDNQKAAPGKLIVQVFNTLVERLKECDGVYIDDRPEGRHRCTLSIQNGSSADPTQDCFKFKNIVLDGERTATFVVQFYDRALDELQKGGAAGESQ